MKVYRGWIDPGLNEIYVTVTEDGKTKPLPFYHEVYNHSPAGFAWGYGGSGPAQLALAILCDHFQDSKSALGYYQDFKWAIVAKWPQHSPFEISAVEIDFWITSILTGRAK